MSLGPTSAGELGMRRPGTCLRLLGLACTDLELPRAAVHPELCFHWHPASGLIDHSTFVDASKQTRPSTSIGRSLQCCSLAPRSCFLKEATHRAPLLAGIYQGTHPNRNEQTPNTPSLGLGLRLFACHLHPGGGVGPSQRRSIWSRCLAK